MKRLICINLFTVLASSAGQGADRRGSTRTLGKTAACHDTYRQKQ